MNQGVAQGEEEVARKDEDAREDDKAPDENADIEEATGTGAHCTLGCVFESVGAGESADQQEEPAHTEFGRGYNACLDGDLTGYVSGDVI